MQILLRDGDPSRVAGVQQPLVLVALAEPRLACLLDRALAAAGYRVEHAADGLQALGALERLLPDVVVLDSDMPGLHGIELARQVRVLTAAPIVLLSASDSVEDRVTGLDAGADDVIGVPFALNELLARLRALRRGRALTSAGAAARLSQGTLAYADIRLDLDTREVLRGDRKLDLRNKGFELLACFLRHPGRVLSKRQLLEDVWGYAFLGDSNVIEVTVSHVRQALEAGGEPRLIHTVRPIGYILTER